MHPVSIVSLSEQILDRQRRLLTIDEYELLGSAGVLKPDERTELIEGSIIRVAPMSSIHASLITRIYYVLHQALQGAWQITSRTPLHLGQFNEPEPDFSILSPRDDWYESRLPEASDVALLIEISDTTIKFDRQVKLPMYARHGVPEVWVIDVAARRVEVYRNPEVAGYTFSQTHDASSVLTIERVEGAVIQASLIL